MCAAISPTLSSNTLAAMVVSAAAAQGLTLVQFSAQPEPL
jgi:type II secretory pathway component PulM